ncbi:4-hydroxybenzoate octaprenyltransferase [Hyphomicrobiales bacterium]|nr:4-hydroxybenzoate octaprenyltransferase [Hyphomicrobiales bacterium]
MINLTKLFYDIRIKSKPFYELARYDKPIGFLLLMWPCLWSYAVASSFIDKPLDLFYVILFIIGSIVMRGAGCTWNDYLDKHYDAKVERTKNRPLAANKISENKALIFLFIQLVIGFLILIQFNKLTILIGIFSIIPITIYPLMKRITWWPQLFLGITFNWGALLGWTAMTNNISIYSIVLYIGCVFWTIGYDTIYAHQDKIDDDFLGLKSSAIFLDENSKIAISIFYLVFFISISFLSLTLESINDWLNYIILTLVGIHLVRQIYLLDINDPSICHSIFKSNNSIGFIVFFLFFIAA